jgi:predicted nucleic acid-binding protein
MKVFIDTGAFYASAISSDARNKAAKAIFLKLQNSKARLSTSDYVLAETYTLLNAREGHRAAVAFMDAFEDSGINILRVSAAVETRAKNIFRKLDTPRLSFFDCTSFALINAHALDHAFSFDAHFAFFRFNHPVIILSENIANN